MSSEVLAVGIDYEPSPELSQHLGEFHEALDAYQVAFDKSEESEEKLHQTRKTEAELKGETLPSVRVVSTGLEISRPIQMGTSSRVVRFDRRKHSHTNRGGKVIYFGETSAARETEQANDNVLATGLEAYAQILQDESIDPTEKTLWGVALTKESEATFNPEAFVAEAMGLIDQVEQQLADETHVVWSSVRRRLVSSASAGEIIGFIAEPGSVEYGTNDKIRIENAPSISFELGNAAEIVYEKYERVHEGGRDGYIGSGQWVDRWIRYDELDSMTKLKSSSIPLVDSSQILGSPQDSFFRLRQLATGDNTLTEPEYGNAGSIHDIFEGAVYGPGEKGKDAVFFGSKFSGHMLMSGIQFGTLLIDAPLYVAIAAGVETDLTLDSQRKHRFAEGLVAAIEYNAKSALGMETGKKPKKCDLPVAKLLVGLRANGIDQSFLETKLAALLPEVETGTLADKGENERRTAIRAQANDQIDQLFDLD